MNNVVSMMTNSKRLMWTTLGFLVVFCIVIYIGYSQIKFNSTLTKIFQDEQGYNVNLTQNLINDHLEEASQNLQLVIEMITDLERVTKTTEEILRMVYKAHAEDFFSLSIIDLDGNIIVSSKSSFEFDNLFGEIEIEGGIENTSTEIFLSERIISESGQPVTFLFAPFSLSPEQPIDLYMAGELHLKQFIEMQLKTIHGEKISFVLADYVGDIYSILNKAHKDYPDMERGNLFALSQECLNCHKQDSFDDIKESGSTKKIIHSLFRTPKGEIMNRTTAPMSVFNEEWIVSISQPYEAIQGQISRNFVNNFVAVAVLLFGIIFGIFFVYRERNKRFLEIQYSSLINNINVGIFRASANGDVIDMNQAMLSLLGQEDGTEFKDRKIESFLRYKTDWQGIINSFSKTSTPKEGNYWVKRQGHGDFLALFLLRAVKDNEGEISYIEGVLQDITDMKRAEEERIRVTRLESIELLAGGIAHDFNNQLTAIVGNISLSRLANDPKKRNELLLNAEKASFRAQGLTQQLLTFSRGGSPVKAPDSVEPIIRDCADFVLRGSNCKIEYNFDTDLKLANIDTEQIRQVVQNLVINANQAMPGGGVISITAANETVSNINSLTPGDYVKIIIQDSGSGIPPEIVDKIFDPYFTTKETGSGLGLAVSYSVVKKHGGVIFVNSTPGTGTIFTVYLPTAESNKSTSQDEDAGKIIHGTGNVLVIDDDPSVGETLVSFLDELGYEPYYVTNGNEAIRLLKENKLSFDIVVTDLTLPGGMGGVEIKDQIRQIYPDMKIIVASGYSNDPVLSKHREYGFDGVIRKPFRITTVAEVLHRELQK